MRYPILGSKDLFLIDKDLQNFTKEYDERYLYNTDTDYINYITNLTIQNIIYYIKNNYGSWNYFTEKPSKYIQDNEYVFKLTELKLLIKKLSILLILIMILLIIFMNLTNQRYS